MNEHKANAEQVAKYGKPGRGNWLVVLKLASGATMAESFPSREQAEAARSRAASRPEYIRAAFVHYCD